MKPKSVDGHELAKVVADILTEEPWYLHPTTHRAVRWSELPSGSRAIRLGYGKTADSIVPLYGDYGKKI